MDRKWSVPKRKQPVWRFVKPIMRPFCKLKELEFLGEEFPDKCIIVANHNNKKGPMLYELNLPVYHITWGAYQMLGSYKDRYLYLRNVLYIQKNGVNKVKATIKASFEALFSIFFYKGMKVLPSYPDARLRKTLQYSMDTLDSNTAIMVFPEDSGKGYFDEMVKFFPGFVMLAEQYYKKTGEDVPVFPMYWGRKKNKIVVGKPLYVNEMAKEGLDRYQIADKFKEEINTLYRDHFKE